MPFDRLRSSVRADLEAEAADRRIGTGWLSGVSALVASTAGLIFVVCLRYPNMLAVPPLREFYATPWFHLALHVLLIGAFLLAILNLVLRPNKILGFTAIALTLLATLIGGAAVESSTELTGGLYLGLDWFVLNVVFTGLLFVPLEKFFPRYPDQPLFRHEWREDLLYYLASSLLIQSLTFLSMAPAIALAAHTHWDTFRAGVSAQPVALQLLEVMFLTDLVQYGVHRAFHRIPFLWRFHAIHHSVQSMDWLASARFHFLEIVLVRATTIIPMYILGFAPAALTSYLLFVYIHATLVHANVGWNFDRIGPFLVTPRFHHWHHGSEKSAIDINFAIHFPLIDRIFGTYHLPIGEWPASYGLKDEPLPPGYLRQFLVPFRTRKKPAAEEPRAGKDI